jgi:hypothetical protein
MKRRFEAAQPTQERPGEYDRLLLLIDSSA